MKQRICAEQSSAYRRLLHAYENRYEHLAQCRAAGKKAVGCLGYGVCSELITAAGMAPVAICADADYDRALADKYLEYSFTEKGKCYFAKLVGGLGSVTPEYAAIGDSEDVMNRVYYYAREVQRSEPERDMPELYFVDWLFSRHMMYQGWNKKALARFQAQLEAWSGAPISEEALKAAIGLSNRQFAAMEKLRALRRCEAPRVTGCEALVIIGAKNFMDAAEYTECLETLACEAADWPEAEGGKVYFSGSVQHDVSVYEVIEAHGLIVCGEDHDWGDRAFERPIRTDLEPLQALVDSYMLRTPTAQKGLVAERVDAMMDSVAAAGAKAVVFYTDEYDEAASWDYPSQKKALDGQQIPSANFCKRKLAAAEDAELAEGLEALKTKLEGGAQNG